MNFLNDDTSNSVSLIHLKTKNVVNYYFNITDLIFEFKDFRLV